MLLVDDATWYRNKNIDKVDCVVIGAGVVGLACARALALRGREVVILDMHDCIGSETSSRNSEVIHAGIYYAAGSNKAKWCVLGKHQLYEYCAEKNIPHNKIGKLIIATNTEEASTLKNIQERAVANGVNDLQYLTAEHVHELEPLLSAEAGLYSPSTGIIDSHTFMLSLLGDAETAGAMLAVNSKVIKGSLVTDGVELIVNSEGQQMQIFAGKVVNAAGLHASAVSHLIDGIDKAQIPTTYYRKGDYFTYAGKSPFQHLIYPVPVPGGLGIHSTVDLAGQLRFGPDVELIETLNYDVDDNKKEKFAESICKYWPGVCKDLLQPGYAGVRPSLVDQTGDGFKDFELRVHSNFVSLYGIESPGLTASLAIADAVTEAAV